MMQQRVAENEKISILFNTNTESLFGEEFVEGAHLVNSKGLQKNGALICRLMVFSWP